MKPSLDLLDILEDLEAGEDQAEADGEHQRLERGLLVVLAIAWCAQVTVAPESSRISVLRNGMPQVGTGSMPSGGQEVAMVIGRVERAPEERPEEGEEEEHLGGDEQGHADAQALGHHVGVVAAWRTRASTSRHQRNMV